jgi:hypothetical protein
MVSDQPLDPDESLCLEAGEQAVLASDRVTFTLTGGGCFTLSTAESMAFAEEDRALRKQVFSMAKAALAVAMASGDEVVIEQAKESYRLAAEQAPDEQGLAVEPAVVGSPLGSSNRPVRPPAPASGRPRVSASRPSGSPVQSTRPVIFRIASGSAGVLERLPRGTIVQRASALCLNDGEQVTINASTGQSVTYRGPGCLNRQERPTRDNLGGFTFGWRRPDGIVLMARAQ